MKIRPLLFVLSYSFLGFAQNKFPIVDNIDLANLESGKSHKLWLSLAEDFQNKPITIPVLITKGKEEGPVLGLTAAIHGNELNGIPIIHDIFENLDPSSLKGVLVAIPGLNPLAIDRNQREFIDGTDLNRIFPGKKHGNRSEQMAYQIGKKVIPIFDYHIDLHTASFGRINSLYGRGDMNDSTLSTMLRLIEPDLIVSNKGKASFGTASGLTMRAYALSLGVKSITVEYGNPQVLQENMIARGVKGIKNLMTHLGMLKGKVSIPVVENVCSKSYWIYTQEGGYLEVLVKLNQKVEKGEKIAIMKDSFGTIVQTYFAPESGIVVGKSTNPVAISGSRIIHLGVLTEQ